ncbi:MAG TPA: hypothetical protein VGR67_14070 [Candidatus Polarisedimenticolia bacterium]|jgi:hypothetical protein|nr:hypothetical protein [Candidatus Polarisedimenticolia bacterium]
MKTPPHRLSTEEREIELEREVERRRELLIEKFRSLGTSVKTTFDPFSSVRRHPVGGFAAGVAAGVLLSSASSALKLGRNRDKPEPSRSPIAAVVGSLLPAIGPLVLRFFRRRAER